VVNRKWRQNPVLWEMGYSDQSLVCPHVCFRLDCYRKCYFEDVSNSNSCITALWKLAKIMLHLLCAGFIGLSCYFAHRDISLCIFNKLYDNVGTHTSLHLRFNPVSPHSSPSSMQFSVRQHSNVLSLSLSYPSLAVNPVSAHSSKSCAVFLSWHLNKSIHATSHAN